MIYVLMPDKREFTSEKPENRDTFFLTPINEIKKKKPMPLTPKAILDVVVRSTGISYEQMRHKTRKREVVQARQIAMIMIHKFTAISMKDIGVLFGGRDHTTVIHGRQTISDLRETETDLDNLVNNIEGELIAMNGGEHPKPRLTWINAKEIYSNKSPMAGRY